MMRSTPLAAPCVGLQTADLRNQTNDPAAALVRTHEQLVRFVSPFPDLRPFKAGQHRVFFGRSRDVADLTPLLRSGAPTSRRSRAPAGAQIWHEPSQPVADNGVITRMAVATSPTLRY